MHFSIPAVVVGLVAVASAQVSLQDLPQCAQGAVGTAINVPGCSGLDIKCICSNSAYLTTLSCKIAQTCSASDQAKAIAFATSLCATAGVTVPSSVVCSGTTLTGPVAPSTSAASSPPPASTSAPSSTPASSSVAPSSSKSSTSSSTKPSSTLSTSALSPSASLAYNSTTPQQVSVNAAQNVVSSGMGLIGAIAAFMAFV